MDINKLGKRVVTQIARLTNSLSTNKPVRRLATRAAWAIDNWSEITGYAGGLAIFIAAAVTVHGVLTLYFGGSPYWQIELSVYLLIMAALVGAAYTQKHGGHISCDIVTIAMPPKPREILHLVASVVTMVVIGVIIWYAWPWWWQYAVVEQGHSETLWGPSLILPYILIPLGLSFLLLQYIVYITRKIIYIRDLFRGQQD